MQATPKEALVMSATTEAPVALVTGAGQRIGTAIARHLHQAGYRIAVHYRRSAASAPAGRRTRSRAPRQQPAAAG